MCAFILVLVPSFHEESDYRDTRVISEIGVPSFESGTFYVPCYVPDGEALRCLRPALAGASDDSLGASDVCSRCSGELRSRFRSHEVWLRNWCTLDPRDLRDQPAGAVEFFVDLRGIGYSVGGMSMTQGIRRGMHMGPLASRSPGDARRRSAQRYARLLMLARRGARGGPPVRKYRRPGGPPMNNFRATKIREQRAL